MNNIIDLKEKRKTTNKFYDIRVKGLTFIEVLDYALSHFYARSCDADGIQPMEYNPILYYDIMACFSPHLMNISQSRMFDKSKPWQPWPSFNGVKRTNIFLNEIKSDPPIQPEVPHRRRRGAKKNKKKKKRQGDPDLDPDLTLIWIRKQHGILT